jgi:hypothetical protein
MQPESKPLSIPDFNPLPMRTIQILTLTACCLLISFYSYSQNLQFNSAVFYEYSGGMADGDASYDIITSGVLNVGDNKVLKITSVGGTIGGTTDFRPGVIVLLNEKTIANSSSDIEIYLPTGTYNIGFADYPSVSNPPFGEVKGFISGVLYDVVP